MLLNECPHTRGRTPARRPRDTRLHTLELSASHASGRDLPMSLCAYARSMPGLSYVVRPGKRHASSQGSPRPSTSPSSRTLPGPPHRFVLLPALEAVSRQPRILAATINQNNCSIKSTPDGMHVNCVGRRGPYEVRRLCIARLAVAAPAAGANVSHQVHHATAATASYVAGCHSRIHGDRVRPSAAIGRRSRS